MKEDWVDDKYLLTAKGMNVDVEVNVHASTCMYYD